MPTYQYRCTHCQHELEVVQKFSDSALTVCPSCDGELRKIYNAVGVVFKGSGFYKTDSRTASGTTSGESSGATKKSESPSTSTGGSSTGTGTSSDSGAGSSSSGSAAKTTAASSAAC